MADFTLENDTVTSPQPAGDLPFTLQNDTASQAHGVLYNVAKGIEQGTNSMLAMTPLGGGGALLMRLGQELGLIAPTATPPSPKAALDAGMAALGAPEDPNAANTLSGRIGQTFAANAVGTAATAGLSAGAAPAEMVAESGLASKAGNLLREGYNAVLSGGKAALAHPGTGVLTDAGAAVGQQVLAPVGADVGGRIGQAIDGDTGQKVGSGVGAGLFGAAGATVGGGVGTLAGAGARPGGIGVIPRLGGKDYGTGAVGSLNGEGAATTPLGTGNINVEDLTTKFNTIKQQTEDSIHAAIKTMQGPGNATTREEAASNLHDTLTTDVLPKVNQMERAAYSQIENRPVKLTPILKDIQANVFNPKSLNGRPMTAKVMQTVKDGFNELRNMSKGGTVPFKALISPDGTSSIMGSIAQHMSTVGSASNTLKRMSATINAGIKAQYPDDPAIDNAFAITKWKHDTFDPETAVGTFLKNQPATAKTGQRVLDAPRIGQTMQDISTRANSPEVQKDMHDLIASALNDVAAVKGPEAALKWQQSPQTQAVLRDYPVMRATMDAGANDLHRALTVREQFDKNAFLSKYGTDPDIATTNLLKRGDPGEVSAVMSKLENDPKNLETFRQLTIKNFLKLHGGMQGQNGLASALADMSTQKTRNTLYKVLGTDQYANLQSLLTAASKFAGNPSAITQVARQAAGTVGRVLGAMAGPGHLGSGSLIIAGIRAKAGQRVAESMFRNVDPDTVIARAVQDPNYRKFLMSKVPENKADVQHMYKQLRRITAAEDGLISAHKAEEDNKNLR